MNYVVIELQTNGSTTATLVTVYADRLQAESKFHDILRAAAVSSMEAHSAVIMTEDGKPVRPAECYHHYPEPEPEPVEEPEETA